MGLTVKLLKVQFATSQLSFLGHLISPEGVHLDMSKTQSICDFPTPRNVKDIARFLGMVNFFHNFILNFGQVAAPMNALHKKGVWLQWDKTQAASFEQVTLATANPPVLATADFSWRFIVQTDVSSVVVAAVLLQRFP